MKMLIGYCPKCKRDVIADSEARGRLQFWCPCGHRWEESK